MPASVTHVYTAVGSYAISATATVADGNGGTYAATTGGALDSSFGAGGVAQVGGSSWGAPSVAIDPNGDLAVALPSGELTLYKSDGQPDSQFTPVNTGLGGPVAVQPDGKVLVAGDVQVLGQRLLRLPGRDRRKALTTPMARPIRPSAPMARQSCPSSARTAKRTSLRPCWCSPMAALL